MTLASRYQQNKSAVQQLLHLQHRALLRGVGFAGLSAYTALTAAVAPWFGLSPELQDLILFHAVAISGVTAAVAYQGFKNRRRVLDAIDANYHRLVRDFSTRDITDLLGHYPVDQHARYWLVDYLQRQRVKSH